MKIIRIIFIKFKGENMDYEKQGKKMIGTGFKLIFIFVIFYGYLFLYDMWGFERALISLVFFSMLNLSGNLNSISQELKRSNDYKIVPKES